MWRTVEAPGLANGLSRLIGRWDARGGELPSFREAKDLLIASDYSGDHKGSAYQVISFLIVDPTSLRIWEPTRRKLRSSLLKDTRRIAFKSLSDRRRRAALVPLLQAASQLYGLCAVFAIHRSVQSMFSRTRLPHLSEIPIPLQGHWTRRTFERLLRVVDLLALLLAGVSWPNQDILWITDNDDIVADVRHHRDAVNILAIVSSHYLTHNLRHLRVATARSDPGGRQLEDLLSIPDLIGGAAAELLSRADKNGGIPGHGLIVPLPAAVTDKTRFISHWLSFSDRPLKCFVAEILSAENGARVSQRILGFSSAIPW